MTPVFKKIAIAATAAIGLGANAAAFDIKIMPKQQSLDGNLTSDLVWRADSSAAQALWLMNGNYSSDATIINPPDPNMGAAIIVLMGDFGGDGKSDLLWRTPTGGYWLTQMNGLQVASTHEILPAASNPGGDWVVVQKGDFNGDGKADLLWKRTSDGVYAIWQMNGPSIAPGDFAILDRPDTGYEVVAIADLNGDGHTDLVWQDQGGNVFVQIMTGVVANKVISTGSAEGAMAGYSVSLLGDFNGDHKVDIIWNNASNDHKLWLMNGTSILSNTTLLQGGTTWHATFARDLDADGKTDLIWEDSSDHRVGMWLMNGAQADSYGTLFGQSNPGWTMVHMADLNGDNKWDAIFRKDSDGSVATWLIAGGAAYAYATVAGPNSGFSVVPLQ